MAISRNFDIRKHYWLVGVLDDARVWSSERVALLPLDDPEYQLWVDMGGVPTPIEGMDALRSVLADLYPDGIDTPSWVHIAYFKAALADLGKLDAVNAAVLASGPHAKALWDNATSVRIDDADVVAIAAALNVNLVTVFTAANNIRKARS